MKNYLTPDFLKEILRLCFLKRSIIESVVAHMKYQYVPSKLKEYKEVFKSIIEHYKATNTLPTYGLITQRHESNGKLIALISEIKEVAIPNESEILKVLEKYIKDIRFQILMQESVEMYNEGRKEEAINILAKESEEISNFNISSIGKFTRIFSDSVKRIELRRNDALREIPEKVPFSIPEIDKITQGGMDEGETAIFMMRSGGGKSTFLRWVSVHAAMLGYPTLHVSGEDTKKINEEKIDQVWTNTGFFDIKNSNIPKAKLEKIQKVVDSMKARRREMYLYSFEEFDEATMKDVRQLIIEYHKITGEYPKLLALDYLEMFAPGDGMRYGFDNQSVKMKLTNSARKLKNICKEFPGLRAITATQASDVHISSWNDPTFVLTRSDTKGDKNLADSFSYFITGNQTIDERKNNIIRLHTDKLRNYSSDHTVKHLTDYGKGRFYKRGEVPDTDAIGVESFKKARKKLKEDK